MKKFYFLLLLLFSPLYFFAQNISGTWRGVLTQQPGGYSSRYTYELILRKKGNCISGISRTYILKEIISRLNISGHLNDNLLNLTESEILEEVKPNGWVICIKNMRLIYFKKDNIEYLEGSWAGIGTDGGPCSPGGIYLSRISSDTLEVRKASSAPKVIPVVLKNPTPSIPITLPRIIEPVKTLYLKNKNITVMITDYGEIDDDTITVFLNKKEIITKERISKQPIRMHLQLTEAHNELLLYAENLGRIPPNTSTLKIIDGLKIYRIIIQSSFQKSGAVYINLKSP